MFSLIAIIVGWTSGKWLWCLVIVIIYLVLLFTFVYFMKYVYSKPLRQSHFLLAVFCRAENNRHYYNLGLELRPGYLGKWIELRVINLGDH